jgi:hypothetical protein
MALDLIGTILLLAIAQPAQPQGPLVLLPRVTPEPGCEVSADPDEVVVCGESSENSPFRIPEQFRSQPSHDDADASWDARTRDQEALERFSSQNVGPSGLSQHSRQTHCQWLAARQEAQGRRPDCGLRPRRDAPTDWQRR